MPEDNEMIHLTLQERKCEPVILYLTKCALLQICKYIVLFI